MHYFTNKLSVPIYFCSKQDTCYKKKQVNNAKNFKYFHFSDFILK